VSKALGARGRKSAALSIGAKSKPGLTFHQGSHREAYDELWVGREQRGGEDGQKTKDVAGRHICDSMFITGGFP
jgi:hypothetical protein